MGKIRSDKKNIIFYFALSVFLVWLVIDFYRYAFGKGPLNFFGTLDLLENNSLQITIPLALPNLVVDTNNIFLGWLVKGVNVILTGLNGGLFVLQSVYNVLVFLLQYIGLLLFT